MIPVEKGMVSSQFLITFRPLPGLNGKRVVSNTFRVLIEPIHVFMESVMFRSSGE